jgi:sugar/nucleoside kinase (ribokinase family)
VIFCCPMAQGSQSGAGSSPGWGAGVRSPSWDGMPTGILYRQLVASGLNAQGLLRDAEVASGVALIIVDSQGHNLIATASGSNRRLTVAIYRSSAATPLSEVCCSPNWETPLRQSSTDYAGRQRLG